MVIAKSSETSFEALVWIHGRQPGAGVVLHRLRTSLKFKLEIGHEMPPSPSLREPPLGNLFPLKLFAFHIHDKSFCPVAAVLTVAADKRGYLLVLEKVPSEGS